MSVSLKQRRVEERQETHTNLFAIGFKGTDLPKYSHSLHHDCSVGLRVILKNVHTNLFHTNSMRTGEIITTIKGLCD